MNEGQALAKYFTVKFNLKFNQKQFIMQMAVAKSLLKDHEYDDLIAVFDYVYKHPPKNGITSMGYIPYIINEVLPKAKAMRIKEEEDRRYESLAPVDLSENKRINVPKKSMFKNYVIF